MLTRDVMAFIVEWGCWYIQYPKFSYFRLEGFDGNLHLLTRCCNHGIVLMETIYQALAVNAKFVGKHKTECHKFPMKLGEYSCAHLVAAKAVCDELSHLRLGLYTS